MGDEGPLARGTMVAGRYEVVRAIGSGAMGHVYHVRDRDLDEDIALKLIARPGGDDWDPRHEVRLARRVTHPNVARTFDLGRHGEARFITMELVRGESLLARITGGRRLSLPEALRIASHLARGIVAAHAAGVVHRDLKPSNVMLDRERVVITDFGVALGLHEGARGAAAVGTPGYMAPEQVSGGWVDGRADVYALGVLLFRVLAGRMPFSGDAGALLAATVEATVPDLRTLDPSIPNEVAAVVRDAVATDRACRIDAATFMRRVERIRGDVDQVSTAEEISAPQSVSMPTVVEQRPSTLGTTVDAAGWGPAPGPARELYERARRTLMAMTGPPVREAVALLERAHELAPDDPSILSALGMGLARLGMALGVQRSLARAEELSIRAVLADPTRGETLSTLAFLRAQEGDIRAAVRIFRAALSRDPNEASAHLFLGELLCEAGRPEGERHFAAIEHGPFAARMASMRARIDALHGDHAGALDALARLASFDPGLVLLTRRRIALWGNDAKVLAQTAAELERGFAGVPMEPPYPTILRIGVAGVVDPAIEITREIEASELPARPRTWCHQVAVELLARSGQRDRALDGLLVAASLALTDLVWLDRCPPLAGLRGDPRFAQARAMTSARVHAFV